MQKLRFIFSLVFITLVLNATAQYRWDFGVNAGASNYLGEIGGLDETRRDFIFDMRLNRTQYVFGGFARYKVSPQFALNAGINYGRIRANDNNSTNPARVARNLSFRNNILEFSLRGELTLYYDNDASGRGFYNPDFRVYGFLGAAVFHHNPKVRYYGNLEEFNGDLVELQPLETENVEYDLWQFAIPAGIGVYFTYGKRHRFGWEIGYRSTFTDYIDDISTEYVGHDQNTLAGQLANRTTPELLEEINQNLLDDGELPINELNFIPGEKRGDPTNNDGYLFTQFSYSYVLQGRSTFSKRKYSYIKKRKRIRRKTRAKF